MHRLLTAVFVAMLFGMCGRAAYAQESPAPISSAPQSTMASPSAMTSPSAMASPSTMASTQPLNPAPVVEKPVPAPALGGHLPVFDFGVVSTWADPGSTQGSTTSGLHGVTSGDPFIFGAATIPIIGGLTASFDHLGGDYLDTTFARIGLRSGGYGEPGALRRHIDQERLDYVVGKTGIALETGLTYNAFECCFDLQYHTGYVSVTYATPGIKALHGLKLIITEKGSTAAHNPSAATLATYGGLDVRKREYGLSNIATLSLPIDPHFNASITLFNGVYDFFVQAPFPYRFNTILEAANFVISPEATFSLGATNLTQANQGVPFGTNETIRFVNYEATLVFHLDLNKLIK